MTPLDIRPDIEQKPWTDIPRDAPQGMLTRIGLLRHGTSEGRASVAMVVTLDDGTQVVAQTTWRLMNAAVRALAASPVGSEEVA
jgi:hypothetical protein